MSSTTADFLAGYVPWVAEPGDAGSLPVTVPSGYETGTFTAFIWRDRRKGTPLVTMTVGVVGQVVTASYTAVQAAGLIPSGGSAFSGWWELVDTVTSVPRTWLKGPFVLDPDRRSTGTGGEALTVEIANNAITVEVATSQAALDLKANLSVTTRTVSGTTDTLVLADAGKVIETTNGSATTVTVPPASSVAFPAGTLLEVCQIGAGQITLVAGVGVTLNAPNGLKTRVQYSSVSLRLRSTADSWVVAGDTST